jgi:D-alanyl-D-alanine carboxypeptidase
MMMEIPMNERFQQLIDKETAKGTTHAVLLGVQSADRRIDFRGAAGDAVPDDPFHIASITKMYTAAIAMQLTDENKLNLQTPIRRYLEHLDLGGVHIHRGKDFGNNLTVRQLIHQTSGLADYYQGGLLDDLRNGRDREYGVPDVLTMIRGMPAVSAPDGGASHYSDTNYQLLGAVIEAIEGAPLSNVFRKRIFDPIGLTQTCVYDHASQRPEPLPLYDGRRRLNAPLALSSMAPDGGIVSTLDDSLRFLRAYFDGNLFDRRNLTRMMQWNRLFFPLEYGYGLMRFRLPQWMTPFSAAPELIGHSGSSGSFAFYAPKEKLLPDRNI